MSTLLPAPGIPRANVGNKRGTGRALCEVGDCGRIVKGRGLCGRHYMRAYRHGDVTTGEGRYGSGWLRPDGYIETRRTGHVLATAHGFLLMHRLNLFDRIGFGPHRCHWCSTPINWGLGVGKGVLVVDHVDADRSNNQPPNLVPSCHPCNIRRSK